jgi:hypothetical protein
MLRTKLLGTTFIGFAIVGACGTAHAGATATVNGVTFPVGIVSGGNQLDSAVLYETAVTAAGQTAQGVGIVTSIFNSNGVQIWQSGNNNVELAYTFSYVASSVTAPTGTAAGVVNFSSGTENFYTLPANTQINGLAGGISADIAAVVAGTPFLTATAPKFDAAGDVLTSTIPAGTSLTAFSGGTGGGDLDITGGPAGSYFATGTFANAFDLGNISLDGAAGFSDMTFTSDFTTGAGGDFVIGGSATVKANAVPEPVSLSLLGFGLVAIGIVRRMR